MDNKPQGVRLKNALALLTKLVQVNCGSGTEVRVSLSLRVRGKKMSRFRRDFLPVSGYTFQIIFKPACDPVAQMT